MVFSATLWAEPVPELPKRSAASPAVSKQHKHRGYNSTKGRLVLLTAVGTHTPVVVVSHNRVSRRVHVRTHQSTVLPGTTHPSPKTLSSGILGQ